MKINNARKIIRNQIRKILKEQEYYVPKVKIIKDTGKVPPKEEWGEDLGGGRSRYGTVEFEGVVMGPWKPAQYFDVTPEAAAELFQREQPISYVYDDAKKKITRSEFLATFKGVKDNPKTKDFNERDALMTAVKDFWDNGKNFKKVINMYPKGKIPPPANDYSKAIGNPTIGVGHLIETEAEFEKFKKYTISNICTNKNLYGPMATKSFDDLLMSDKEILDLYYEDLIEHSQFKSRIKKPITQSMFNALVSFAFNAGWESYRPIERIIKKINAGLYKQAQASMLVLATKHRLKDGTLVDSQGLIDRRKAEAKLFGKEGLTPPKEPKVKTGVAGSELE